MLTFLQNPPHRADVKGKTRPGKCLSNPLLAHRRAENFQSHDEIWKSIDRFGRLDDGVLSFLVNPLRPFGNRGGSEKESL